MSANIIVGPRSGPITNLVLSAIITPSGTTGNRTINRPRGAVNIAAAGDTITVTNSLVTTNSSVDAWVSTNDSTAVINSVVPANGSFTVHLSAPAMAETRIDFIVYN